MKKLTGLVLAAALHSIAFSAHADGKTIELVVPFATGGSTDVYARFLAKELATELKANLIVVNRPGAGGGVGAAAVARAVPDGKTILLGTISTHAINSWIYSNMPYDPAKDFTPVAKVVAMPNVLVVRAESPIKSVDDLVNASKARQLTFGSAGGGTTSNLAGELMKQVKPEMKLTHVPYKGSAPAITDLIGGHTDLQFDNLTSLLGQIQSGRLRALAVSSAQPSEQLPGVKPLAEQGFKGYDLQSWFGIFLPKGASAATVAELSEALKRAYAKPEFLQQIKAAGITPDLVLTPEFNRFVAAEQDKWGKVVKAANIKLD